MRSKQPMANIGVRSNGIIKIKNENCISSFTNNKSTPIKATTSYEVSNHSFLILLSTNKKEKYRVRYNTRQDIVGS